MNIEETEVQVTSNPASIREKLKEKPDLSEEVTDKLVNLAKKLKDRVKKTK